MPVITGAAQYPEGIIEQLKTQADVISVDALALAEQAGNIKAVNVVLLGILSNSFDFDEAVWQRSLEMSVPEKFLELNKKAFALGRALK